MENDAPDLLERLRHLELLVEQMQRALAEKEQEIAELRAKLAQDSGNSHRPPSSDPPGSGTPKKRRASRRRKRSGRRPGGQPGHKGSTRTLLKPSAVDHIESLRPAVCQGCGASLDGASLEPSPERHQVFELPEIRPVVTEYQLNACACGKCGMRNKSGLPEGVSWSAFGPGVHALVATLSGQYHLSRRRIQQLLADFFGLKVSLGAIVDMQTRVTAAMAPAVDELRAEMHRTTAPTGMDETGWRQAGERRWLWIAITDALALFAVRDSRGGKVVQELVGDEAGSRVIVTDRWSAYHQVPLARRQFCWSHLLRDFLKMADAPNEEAKRLGSGLFQLGTQMFRWWHQVRAGDLTRQAFRDLLQPLKAWVVACLHRGAECAHAKTAGTCRELLKKQAALWTFARVEGVEPTNNHTERALRSAVIWRKISLGTQSDQGARFVERILSIATSLQRQGRSVYDFLLDTVQARFSASRSPPSLLPSAVPT